MEKVDCFIRKNTSELRKRIEDLGVEVCCCASFKSSIWLDYDSKLTKMVHGAPLYDDEKQGIICFLKAMCDRGSIDCGDNEEMFLALIALSNDKVKWHIFEHNGNQEWHFGNIDDGDSWHKATVQEIVEHFKTK